MGSICRLKKGGGSRKLADRLPSSVMSDSSRFNSPSRKSRFRAQARSRPAGYPPDPGTAEEGTGEEIAASDEAEVMHDPYAGVPEEELTGEPITPESYAPADVPEDHVPTDMPEGYAAAQAPAEEENSIPAGLRLTRDSNLLVVRQGLSTAMVTTLVIAALVAGTTLGYFFGNAEGKNAVRAVLVTDGARNKSPLDLSGESQAAIDTAFDNTKHARYDDARKQFEALFAKHPEWPSMEIEAARAALYARDFQGAQTLLGKATQDRPLADAALLTALLHLTAQEYDAADVAFAAAVATDPARADIYYFWGENLRREGKPLLAAEKFKAALARNQYENVEPLYLLKYWISLVQSDQEGPSGEGAKIDAGLATPHPSSAALFAGAARAVKAADYKAAAGFLTRAQAITDPTVFGVVLRDPTFLEANLQPELQPFYK